MTDDIRSCRHCAAPLQEREPGKTGPLSPYCSRKCRSQQRLALDRASREKPCATCGVMVSKGKTCSVVCYRRTVGIPDERCRWCGIAFEPQHRTSRTCSPVCAKQLVGHHIRTVAQPARVESMRIKPKQCMGCGAEFTPKDSTYATFCTRECAWENRSRIVPGSHTELWCLVPWAQCSKCSAWFVVKWKRTECSTECRRLVNQRRAAQYNRDRLTALGIGVANLSPICAHCGSAFTYKGMGRTPKFCSSGCRKADVNGRPTVRLSRHVYRRLRKMKVKASRDRIDPMVVFERDGWQCGICHRKIDKTIGSHQLMSPTVDHIIPFAKGGTHTWLNVQAAHLICNSKKGDRGSGQPRLL